MRDADAMIDYTKWVFINNSVIMISMSICETTIYIRIKTVINKKIKW